MSDTGSGPAEVETPAQDAVEPTKLAEGYFEIEAIRRRRLRKGQLQYLVKWLVTLLPHLIYSLFLEFPDTHSSVFY